MNWSSNVSQPSTATAGALIAGGFAMVQGNVKLFRASLRAMSYGVFVGLTVSLITGILTPSYDPTPEIARVESLLNSQYSVSTKPEMPSPAGAV